MKSRAPGLDKLEMVGDRDLSDFRDPDSGRLVIQERVDSFVVISSNGTLSYAMPYRNRAKDRTVIS